MGWMDELDGRMREGWKGRVEGCIEYGDGWVLGMDVWMVGRKDDVDGWMAACVHDED